MNSTPGARLSARLPFEFSPKGSLSGIVLSMTPLFSPQFSPGDTTHWDQLLEELIVRILRVDQSSISASRLINKHWHRCSFQAVQEISLHRLEPQIADFSNVRELTLSSAEATLQLHNLQHLSKLPKVSKLQFMDCTFAKGSGLEHLLALRDLKQISFTKCCRSGSGEFAALKSLRWLENLEFARCSSISDATLKPIIGSTQLRSLSLTNCTNLALRAPQLKTLSELVHLTSLSLAHCRSVDDRSAKIVGSLSSLRSLNIASTNITGAGLRHLKSLHSLQFLSAGGCFYIKDEGAISLGELHSIDHVDLSLCDLTDRSLATLSKMSKLQNLNISGNQFTNRAVACLSQLKSLRTLYIAQAFTLSSVAFTALTTLTALQLNHSYNAGVLRMVTLRRLPFLSSLDGRQLEPHELVELRMSPGEGPLSSTRAISEL